MNEYESTSLPQDARTWAMLSHLSALIGLFGNGLGFILGPLIVWLVKRGDHPFIDEQGKEAVNFQLTVFVMLVVLTLALVALAFSSPAELGVPVVFGGGLAIAVIGIGDVVLTIVAAVRANAGRHYRYPIVFRFIG